MCPAPDPEPGLAGEHEAVTRHIVRVERDVVVGHEQVVELGVHESPAGLLVGLVLDHPVVTEDR